MDEEQYPQEPAPTVSGVIPKTYILLTEQITSKLRFIQRAISRDHLASFLSFKLYPYNYMSKIKWVFRNTYENNN